MPASPWRRSARTTADAEESSKGNHGDGSPARNHGDGSPACPVWSHRTVPMALPPGSRFSPWLRSVPLALGNLRPGAGCLAYLYRIVHEKIHFHHPRQLAAHRWCDIIIHNQMQKDTTSSYTGLCGGSTISVISLYIKMTFSRKQSLYSKSFRFDTQDRRFVLPCQAGSCQTGSGIIQGRIYRNML